MVGAVERVATALRRHGLAVQCLDMNPLIIRQKVGGVPIYNESHTEDVFGNSDIALLSGMTVANSRLNNLLELCLKLGISTVAYGQTGANFGPFYRDWALM